MKTLELNNQESADKLKSAGTSNASLEKKNLGELIELTKELLAKSKDDQRELQASCEKLGDQMQRQEDRATLRKMESELPSSMRTTGS